MAETVRLWGRSFDIDAEMVTLGYSSSHEGPAEFGDPVAARAALAKMRNLRSVSAGTQNFGDREVALVAKVPTLRTLNLQGSGVTDAGLAHLTTLPKLEVLTLKELPLTDASVAHLAKLTSLTYLAIHDTDITAGAIVGLAPLTKLDFLVVGAADLGYEEPFDGVAALSTALPDTDILIKCKQVSFLGGAPG